MSIDRFEERVTVIYYVTQCNASGEWRVEEYKGDEPVRILPAQEATAYMARRIDKLSRELENQRTLADAAERKRLGIRAALLAYINAWGEGSDPHCWGDEVQVDDLLTMVDDVVPAAGEWQDEQEVKG